MDGRRLLRVRRYDTWHQSDQNHFLMSQISSCHGYIYTTFLELAVSGQSSGIKRPRAERLPESLSGIMIVSENISIGATTDYNVLFAHVDPDLKSMSHSPES